ncbi:MAG TPA: hypothetical protein VIM62_08605 [Acidobacteriaceae bacterium]
MEQTAEKRRIAENGVTGCCVTGRRGFISRAMRASVSPAAACFQVAAGAGKALPARQEVEETHMAVERAE